MGKNVGDGLCWSMHSQVGDYGPHPLRGPGGAVPLKVEGGIP
jgi:hypothetical protein